MGVQWAHYFQNKIKYRIPSLTSSSSPNRLAFRRILNELSFSLSIWVRGTTEKVNAGLLAVGLGRGKRRGNPKNISKKKWNSPSKKKEIMGVKKKTWAAHGLSAHEIKKKNMGVKKNKHGQTSNFFHSILGAHVSAFPTADGINCVHVFQRQT